ncbi:hypothetical protein DSLASN_39420 [Desulfoluna limicola]|uniref:Uncharacterized protein n=1 Tax=Desulfoluna limicola TaxID=2810562 RepID=A0ABM7PL92_9BACT|nr:hypothetical protein DSLASN_39420 [Desulfoluna limicola]
MARGDERVRARAGIIVTSTLRAVFPVIQISVIYMPASRLMATPVCAVLMSMKCLEAAWVVIDIAIETVAVLKA